MQAKAAAAQAAAEQAAADKAAADKAAADQAAAAAKAAAEVKRTESLLRVFRAKTAAKVKRKAEEEAAAAEPKKQKLTRTFSTLEKDEEDGTFASLVEGDDEIAPYDADYIFG